MQQQRVQPHRMHGATGGSEPASALYRRCADCTLSTATQALRAHHAAHAPHVPPCASNQTQPGQLQASVDALLQLEKNARNAEDIAASKAACAALLQVCKDAGEWKLLEEQVQVLAKRRGQLKQVGARRAGLVGGGGKKGFGG